MLPAVSGLHLPYVREQCGMVIFPNGPLMPSTPRISSFSIPRTINISERLTRMTLTRMLKLGLNVITTDQMILFVSALNYSKFEAGCQ